MDGHPLQRVPDNRLILGRQSNRAVHELLVELAFRAEEVHVFDCAIRFNVYAIAESRNYAGSRHLKNIHIQRAFTPYQLLDSISSLIKEPTETIRSKIFFFLAPAKQFFDGDVKKAEREHLLQALVTKFEAMQENNFRILISEAMKIQDPIYLSYIEKLKLNFAPIEIKNPRMELDHGKDSNTLLYTNIDDESRT